MAIVTTCHSTADQSLDQHLGTTNRTVPMKSAAAPVRIAARMAICSCQCQVLVSSERTALRRNSAIKDTTRKRPYSTGVSLMPDAADCAVMARAFKVKLTIAPEKKLAT